MNPGGPGDREPFFPGREGAGGYGRKKIHLHHGGPGDPERKLLLKTEKMNKVSAIVEEIGQVPLLVFGNSSGDLAMGVYAQQNGGKAFMLLCDDIERDYGDTAEAEKFQKNCDDLGIQTVSMKDEFETIYGVDVFLDNSAEEEPEAEQLPAA